MESSQELPSLPQSEAARLIALTQNPLLSLFSNFLTDHRQRRNVTMSDSGETLVMGSGVKANIHTSDIFKLYSTEVMLFRLHIPDMHKLRLSDMVKFNLYQEITTPQLRELLLAMSSNKWTKAQTPLFVPYSHISSETGNIYLLAIDLYKFTKNNLAVNYQQMLLATPYIQEYLPFYWDLRTSIINHLYTRLNQLVYDVPSDYDIADMGFFNQDQHRLHTNIFKEQIVTSGILDCDFSLEPGGEYSFRARLVGLEFTVKEDYIYNITEVLTDLAVPLVLNYAGQLSTPNENWIPLGAFLITVNEEKVRLNFPIVEVGKWFNTDDPPIVISQKLLGLVGELESSDIMSMHIKMFEAQLLRLPGLIKTSRDFYFDEGDIDRGAYSDLYLSIKELLLREILPQVRSVEPWTPVGTNVVKENLTLTFHTTRAGSSKVGGKPFNIHFLRVDVDPPSDKEAVINYITGDPLTSGNHGPHVIYNKIKRLEQNRQTFLPIGLLRITEGNGMVSCYVPFIEPTKTG